MPPNMALIGATHGIKRSVEAITEINTKKTRTTKPDPKQTLILNNLGRGVTGTVYQVRQEIAIKVVSSPVCST